MAPTPMGATRVKPSTRAPVTASAASAFWPMARSVALVLDDAAFAEDCLRADVIITPLYAPPGCAATLVIDRDKLRGSGRKLLRAQGKGWAFDTARAVDEDRPWSPAPPAWARTARNSS
ncbi:MAG: hypothetical protein WDN29_14690 [Methylovirgula sp.]